MLTENREGFERLAQLLLEREVVFSEDLEDIFGPRKGGVDPNKMLREDAQMPETQETPETPETPEA